MWYSILNELQAKFEEEQRQIQEEIEKLKLQMSNSTESQQELQNLADEHHRLLAGKKISFFH